MERNYKEDQSNEVEALDSIYCGEMEILATEPFHKFKIPILTEEFIEQEENGIACKLVFTYTEKYPDEAPIIEIEDSVNLDNNSLQLLLEHINKTVTENLGMEMIFSLVSSAQEYLNVCYDEQKQAEEMEKEKKLKELEELERKKFEGTRVTVETFMKWKIQFEDETGIAVKREKATSDGKKLTGKELFLRDTTLNDSDIKFLLEAGDTLESVKIDESLFQNLGDLEFGDEDDEDDEDYVPGPDD